MNIEIQDKVVSKTATNIGVAITFIDDTTASCNWSLNDEHGNSIDSGIDQFTGLTVSDIKQKLFVKLDIQPK
jgi:hypothetical protein